MKAFKLFIWISIIAIIVIVIALMLFFIFRDRITKAYPVDISNQLQAYVAMVGLIIGSISGIGGAIATIYLAHLGLDVAQRQESNEKINFADEKICEAIAIYSEIIINVNNIFTSGLSVMESFGKEAERVKYVPIKNRNEYSDHILVEIDTMADNLKALRDSLQGLCMNEFAFYCFEKSAKRGTHSKHLLNQIDIETKSINNIPAAARFCIEDIAQIAVFVDIASRMLRNANYQRLMGAIEIAAAPNMFGREDIKWNKDIKYLLFTGALILKEEQRDDDKPYYKSSTGAAIISDLLNTLPDGKVIVQLLIERYGLPKYMKKLNFKYDFIPTNILCTSLRRTLEQAHAIEKPFLFISTKNRMDFMADWFRQEIKERQSRGDMPELNRIL